MKTKPPTDPRFIDLTGKTFGRLKVLSFIESRKGQKYWACKCTCGKLTRASGGALNEGRMKSCGCYKEEYAKYSKITHGESGKDTRTREYAIWAGIITRCENPKTSKYHRYGGRGISVCPEWRASFSAFLKDMGRCPKDHSIDRFPNPDGNYEKSNCRWATIFQQANNRCSNRHILFNGEYHTIAEWSRIAGVNQLTLGGRLRAGWGIERALTEQINSTKRNKNVKL